MVRRPGKRLAVLAVCAMLAIGCSTPKTSSGSPVLDDGVGGGSSGSPSPSPAPTPGAAITGTVAAPPPAILANTSPVAAVSSRVLNQDPVAGAEVSLVNPAGEILGKKTTTTDASGSFSFPEVSDAVGNFFVMARFEASASPFELRALATREAKKPLAVRVDVPSTLVASKVLRSVKAGGLDLAAVDGSAGWYLAARLRDKLVPEQVPLMTEAGSEDIVAAMDQAILDDLEIRTLASRAAGKLAAQSAAWTVSTLFDPTRLKQLHLSAGDLAQMGTHTVDADGNLYLATYSSGSVPVVVERITPAGATSSVGTLPAGARSPVALALARDGTPFAVDFREDSREMRLLKGSAFTVIATLPWPTAGTPRPGQVVVDDGGVAFVAVPSHHVVARLQAGGAGSSLIGMPGVAGHKDGKASDARFAYPSGVAFFRGACWVADRDNNVLRSIGPDLTVATEAGSPGDGIYRSGRAKYARLASPVSLASFGTTLYLADAGARRIRRLSGDMVFTVAGSPGAPGGDGPGDAVSFSRPEALAIDRQGVLYLREALVNAAGTTTDFRFRKIAR